MRIFIAFILWVFLMCNSLRAQNVLITEGMEDQVKSITGFMRTGLYVSPGIDDISSFSSVYSELSLKLEIKGNSLFGGSGDARIRYGQEFGRTLDLLDIRELFLKVSPGRFDITIGQQIIKWGKADFTNTTGKLHSVDYLSRMPEPEDRDRGNLLLRARWFPAQFFNAEVVTGPFYRPSVVPTGGMTIPAYISINKLPDLLSGRDIYCFGIRTAFSLRFADFGFSWFEGPDPLPGLRFDGIDPLISEERPFPLIIMSFTPSRIRNLGMEFETTIGNTGIRGETAWTFPEESFLVKEYAQCEQVAWVAGIDRSSGSMRLFAEYSGKFLPDYTPAGSDPVLVTDPDPDAFLAFYTQPGFDFGSFLKQQAGAFNRLSFYQLKEWYHSISARAEAELLNGRMNGSLSAQYNFTSRDFFLRSDLKVKPSDGLTIYGGFELYNGPDGSLFNIIDDYMSGIFLGLRIDFSLL